MKTAHRVGRFIPIKRAINQVLLRASKQKFLLTHA